MSSPCRGTAPPDTYTLSLHDALPIFAHEARGLTGRNPNRGLQCELETGEGIAEQPDAGPEPHIAERHTSDRKSTRLNSSHVEISYAVFCLKKKKEDVPADDGRARGCR